MNRATPSPSHLSASSSSSSSPPSSGVRRAAPSSSFSSSSLTAEQAEFYAYVRQLQLRTNSLLATLGQVDLRAVQQHYPSVLDKLTLLAQQLSALQGDVHSSAALSAAAASVLVYPLVAGYDPSDELRIKAIPEVELQQQRGVQEWLEQNGGGDGVTAEELAERLNAYNGRCAELRAMCAAVSSQQTAQQQQAASDAAELGKEKKSGSRRREDSSEEELQRTLRKAMTGWTLRPDG